MTTFVDPDLHRAASHRNMAEHLTAPLQAGAVDSPVAIAANGSASVGWRTREALLLAAPAHGLEGERLRLDATLPGGAAVALDFAPYTEAGACLPLHRPVVDATGFSAPFTLTLDRLTSFDAAGVATVLPTAQIAARIELHVLEGLLGRLLYIAAAEKQRLRRMGRELVAMRMLGRARDDALDRHGADLGVARFGDTLAFEAGEIVTKVRREPDAEYRRRLSLYRPWWQPARRRLLELLNGPGAAAAPNAGPLGALGLADRFTLTEADNPFAVAIGIVGVEEPGYRDGFLEHVRAVHLIWPRDDPASDAVHTARFVSAAHRDREAKLRVALRDHFNFVAAGPGAAVAPMLGAALVRAGRCRRALGAAAKWKVLRTQRGDAGSRYELGLGADLEPLPATELDALALAHATRAPNPDPETEALLRAMTPRTAAQDPDGRWLLEPCGLRTVHRVDTGTLYVAHLPIFGLTITGPSQLAPTGWTRIVPGDYQVSGFSGLSFYERATGTAEQYATVRGQLNHLRTLTLAKTWSLIVPGKFAGGELTDLLFYDRAAGSAEFSKSDGKGNLTVFRTHAGFRKSWSAIVTGNFSGRGERDLLFYDRSAGEAEVYTTDGAGNLTHRRTHRGLSHEWTHVVGGDFSGKPFTDIAFYDRGSGTLELHASDGRGGLRRLSRLPDWRPGWTHVVAGRFSKQGGTALLFYDRGTGVAEFHATDRSGRIKLLQRHENWRRTWTQIVAGRFGGATGSSADLLFYERATGTAEFYTTNGAGQINLLRPHTGFRRSTPVAYEGRYHAPGDPGTHAVLAAALVAADASWRAAPVNGPAWTALTDAQARAAWPTAAARPAGDPALAVFAAAGLPAVSNPPPVVEQLLRLPAELVVTIRLAGAQAAQILAGQPAAAGALRTLVGILRDQHVTSALPLITGAGDVLIVLGAVGLPSAGLNLSDRRAAGFRWYLVPLQGIGGELGAVGRTTAFGPAEEGVYALVLVGYARGPATDPYEYRLELPATARLSLLQYEFLMNALEHTHPAGVEVNTYGLRTRHVDLDGDGDAEPLAPSVFRTYRQFRRRRHRGQVGVTVEAP